MLALIRLRQQLSPMNLLQDSMSLSWRLALCVTWMTNMMTDIDSTVLRMTTQCRMEWSLKELPAWDSTVVGTN